MSTRNVTVRFNYKVSRGSGDDDPIAYLNKLKAAQKEVIDQGKSVGQYNSSSNMPGSGTGMTAGRATQMTPMQPPVRASSYERSVLLHLQNISSMMLSSYTELKMIRLGFGIHGSPQGVVGPSFGGGGGSSRVAGGSSFGWGGDMGSGLGGGFGRMRLARALMAPTSTAGVAGMFGLGPIGIAAGVGIAGSLALGRGASWAGQLADISQRSDISAGTRERMSEEANPLVGGLRRWWREEVVEPLKGITNAIRESNYRAERVQAQSSSWFGGLPRVSAMRLQESSMANMASVMAGAQAIPYQQFNRSTFQGERAYQEQNVLNPLMARAAQSSRVAEARRMDVLSAENEHRRILDQENTYRARLQGRQNQLSDIMSDPQRGRLAWGAQNARAREVDVRNLVIQAETDLMAITRNREASEARIREYRVASAHATSQERRDQAAILQGELQNVRARREHLAAGATQFGAAGMVGRQMQAAAVEQFFRYGPGGVTQETIEMALQSPASRSVQLRLRDFAEGTSEYRRIREASGEGFQLIRDVDSQENEIQNRMARALVDDQQQLATELSSAFRGSADLILNAMREIYRYIGEQVTEIQRRGASNR